MSADDSLRRGNWAQTFTGRRFWPLDPRPADVCLEDIAHALSNVCRFGGHCREFYSVAQHSVFVSRLSPVGYQLQGLLHDAPEAYLGDMVRPLKAHMPEFAQAEHGVWLAVAARFGVAIPLGPGVIVADEQLLATEARDLMGVKPGEWSLLEEPLAETIEPWAPALARKLFLERFEEVS